MLHCCKTTIDQINLLYEFTIQRLIDLCTKRGLIRPLIRRPTVPIELHLLESDSKPQLMPCASMPAFTHGTNIYRRAESEQQFKKGHVPNLGDSIRQVDQFSRDQSFIDIFTCSKDETGRFYSIIEPKKSDNEFYSFDDNLPLNG